MTDKHRNGCSADFTSSKYEFKNTYSTLNNQCNISERKLPHQKFTWLFFALLFCSLFLDDQARVFFSEIELKPSSQEQNGKEKVFSCICNTDDTQQNKSFRIFVPMLSFFMRLHGCCRDRSSIEVFHQRYFQWFCKMQ